VDEVVDAEVVEAIDATDDVEAAIDDVVEVSESDKSSCSLGNLRKSKISNKLGQGSTSL
jgi:hypothetical protein